MTKRDQLIARPTDEGINAIPMNPLYDSAFYHMQRWLTEKIAPPIQPRIEFANEPVEVVRDEHRIACGGIRLPQAEVPLAQNSAIPLAEDISSVLGGSSHPFTKEKVESLYGDRSEFLTRFEAAAKAAVDASVIRPREVAALVAEAESSWPE